VLLITFAAQDAARADEAQAIVKKVQQRYDATRDFTAEVTQEMTIASLGKTTTAHGTVAFKKPGKMRWELTDGEPQVIVADGETLWFYQPNEHQVLKAPFDAAFRSTTPISFLTGVGRLAEDFEAKVDGSEADGKRVSLLLVSKRDSATVGTLRLTVARASGDIEGAEIRDPLGNVSRLRFAHIERNRGLADDRFVFEVPSGTDVITAPAGN
jgi:outer membrane lipoprotein carrier protein